MTDGLDSLSPNVAGRAFDRKMSVGRHVSREPPYTHSPRGRHGTDLDG
jgi:hypothetical protein